MHSFLVSTPPEKFQPGPDILNLYPEKSIGIAEIRQLIIFLSKKPIASNQNVAIIHNAEKLTMDAQQALLKTLEEPPGNSVIYLVTTQPESLLPTILSRVQIISSPSHTTNQSYKSNWSNFWSEFLAADLGHRLLLLDEQAFDRDSALEFLNSVEFILHTEITLPSPSLRLREGLGESYNLITTTRKYLKSNVNLKLALDNLAINL